MPSKSVSCAGCGTSIRRNKSGLCQSCFISRAAGGPAQPQVTSAVPATPAELLKADREKKETTAKLNDLQKKYKEALDIIERQDSELGILTDLDAGMDTTIKIEPHEGSGTSEATPVIVASDWHSEEIVTPAQVNGLNEFNLDIADQRITKFWQGGLRLVRLLSQDVHINTVVLGLLGDFITNDIHEELVENVALRPTQALIWVQDRIIGGLNFLLNHSTQNYVVVCRVGNHSRTTHKTFFSQENGHSLEHLMYVHLAAYFRNELRLTFVIQDGYHIYLDVYGQTLRFHHGHAINYQGGIGGIFIPAFKSVSQWDKGRCADLDIFGHFHQSKDGGKFLCNGSLIGYNSFAVRIKADYEPPRQTLFMMDKKRGRTCTWPILVD